VLRASRRGVGEPRPTTLFARGWLATEAVDVAQVVFDGGEGENRTPERRP
jgi:hypothetical protein